MSDQGNKRLLFITGMHRSNTSLVAKAFHQAGLFMGSNLLPASSANRDGYFEETSLIRFHDELLREEGYSFWNVTKPAKFLQEHSASRVTKAQQFIRQVLGDVEQGGFKDPRVSLFLPLWEKAVPAAKFVLIFRDPAKVAASIVKRGEFGKWRPLPLWQAYHALKIWSAYNSCLLQFAQKCPDRCILMHAPADLSSKRGMQIEQLITEGWQFDLPALSLQGAINPKLVRSYPTRPFQRLLSWLPHIDQEYEQLQAMSQKIYNQHEGA